MAVTTLADIRGTKRRGRCFICGEEGHWANACPKKRGCEGSGEAAAKRTKRTTKSNAKKGERPGVAAKAKAKAKAKGSTAFSGMGMKLTEAITDADPRQLASFNEAVEQRQSELDATLVSAAETGHRTDTQKETTASGRGMGRCEGGGDGDVIDLCDDESAGDARNSDEHRRLGALKKRSVASTSAPSTMKRLGVQESNTRRRHVDDVKQSSSNFFFSGYTPSSAAGTDEEISTYETVEAEDYKTPNRHYSCKAILDTGNGGCTLITRSLAIRVGIIEPGRPSRDKFSTPSLLPQSVSVRGVVAGASEKLPMCTFAYRLRGSTLRTSAAITTASLGCDVLVSLKDIKEWESRFGYRFRP